MDKVTSYKLLHTGRPGELEAAAQQLVSEGYEPQGAPFVLKVDAAWNFFQAMVKRERELPSRDDIIAGQMKA